MDRRRLLLLAPLLPLAACSGLALPSTLRLSERELAQRLARRFPRTQRVAEVFDVTLSEPALKLLPERNRLACALALQLRNRLTDSRHDGRLAFESGLRWEPQDASLRLSQVAVQQLQLDAGGSGRALSGVLQRVGSLLAEQLLEDLPLWQLPPQQLERLQRAGHRVGEVSITPEGLQVRLEEAPR